MENLFLLTAKNANRLSIASSGDENYKLDFRFIMELIKTACLKGEFNVKFSIFDLKDQYNIETIKSVLFDLKYQVEFYDKNDRYIGSDAAGFICNNVECYMKIYW